MNGISSSLFLNFVLINATDEKFRSASAERVLTKLNCKMLMELNLTKKFPGP